MGKPFLAKKNLAGEECYLCEKLIEESQEVQFYGGPFLIHTVCIKKILKDTCNGGGNENC